jgi:rubrerythrin
MAATYSAKELINIAIGIERRGIIYYDVIARSTENDQARAVFEGLARMERVHLATFEHMLDDIGGAEVNEGEEEGYIATLLADAVFTDDSVTADEAAQADTDIKAMELAINAEKDAILYYYELRDLLPDGLSGLVKRILDEEKRHLAQLTAIRQAMSGT